MEKKFKCIIEECSNLIDPKHNVRMMCRSCYWIASQLIRDKKTTWEELCKLGLSGSTKKQSKIAKFISILEKARKKVNK